jgi:hypothetical protein
MDKISVRKFRLDDLDKIKLRKGIEDQIDQVEQRQEIKSQRDDILKLATILSGNEIVAYGGIKLEGNNSGYCLMNFSDLIKKPAVGISVIKIINSFIHRAVDKYELKTLYAFCDETIPRAKRMLEWLGFVAIGTGIDTDGVEKKIYKRIS